LTTIMLLLMLTLRPATRPRWSHPRGHRVVPSAWRTTQLGSFAYISTRVSMTEATVIECFVASRWSSSAVVGSTLTLGKAAPGLDTSSGQGYVATSAARMITSATAATSDSSRCWSPRSVTACVRTRMPEPRIFDDRGSAPLPSRQ
jgi:hypothetical protein